MFSVVISDNAYASLMNIDNAAVTIAARLLAHARRRASKPDAIALTRRARVRRDDARRLRGKRNRTVNNLRLAVDRLSTIRQHAARTRMTQAVIGRSKRHRGGRK